ncbi:MAG: hypothetical protein OEN52_01875 [Gammaproteobacteria bacterium]|nr:hypothetical protein [Gammaproteobacteria bacterium]
MTDEPGTPQPGTSGLAGVVRLVTASVIFMVAGLAVLMVLDIIPGDVFSEFAKKAVLIASIIVLASAAIALLVRGGKH